MQKPFQRFVQPRVFPTTTTVIDVEGLNQYLDYTGQEQFLEAMNEASRAGLSDAEIICSFYSKLCYKSLVADGRNANITKTRDIWENLESTFDSAHGSVFEHVQFGFVITDCSRVYCYHPEAEVFTLDGWKSITKLTDKDVLMTMAPATRLARWSNVISMHEFPYDGTLYGWRTTQMCSPGMTPDHLLWAAPYDVRRARGLSNEENVAMHAEKQAVSAMWASRFAVDHGVRWRPCAYEPEDIELGQHMYDLGDLMTWLGWMATDSTFPKDRPNQATIYQSKEQYIPEIRALMIRLFADRWREHGPYGDNECVYFTISDAHIAEWARDMLGPNKLKRKLNGVLFCYSSRLLRLFYDAIVKGDGSVHAEDGHEVIYCPSRTAAGQYQVLAARLGMCANVREDDRVGDSHEVNGTEVRNTRVTYVVSVSRKSASLVQHEHKQETHYKGKVYCPKTHDGLIYVRYQGLPFWCGNTHEQVRHRIGVAYSQTSGRYTRLEHIPLVWDPLLNDCRDLAEELMQKTEDTVYLMECRKGLRVPPPRQPEWAPGYVCEADDWLRWRENLSGKTIHELGVHDAEQTRWVPNPSLPFDVKKKLTSAIRRVAPNGQANELGYTVNLRSLRHIIQMRTARAAEWEVRQIYNQIYQILKDRYPLIFYGAKTEMVDGALEVTGMKVNPYERLPTWQELLYGVDEEEVLAFLQDRKLAT